MTPRPLDRHSNWALQLVWNLFLAALAYTVVLAAGWSLWVVLALFVFNLLGYVEGGLKRGGWHG